MNPTACIFLDPNDDLIKACFTSTLNDDNCVRCIDEQGMVSYVSLVHILDSGIYVDDADQGDILAAVLAAESSAVFVELEELENY